MRRLALMLLLPACSLQTKMTTPGSGGSSTSSTSTETSDSSAGTSAPAAAGSGGADWQRQRETEPEWDNERDRPASFPGPDVGYGPAVCDSAHNHCLHGNTWFQHDLTNANMSDAILGLCYRARDRFWSWDGNNYECPDGTLHRTEAASAKTLTVGAIVYVTSDGQVPKTARSTRKLAAWKPVKVVSVDGAAGTFQGELLVYGKPRIDTYPIDVTRVTVESTEWKRN